MKNYVIVILLMLLSVKINAQEIYRQTNVELDESMDETKSYLCQASNSIELLPGFGYSPKSDNSMMLDIDRYSVFPPMEDMHGGPCAEDDGVVGSLPGMFDVGATGAANYSIDIELPKALRNMSPKLSIVYNSQSTNGLLGWSWDLVGISSIERVGQTEYHDGKITSVDFINDRYAIDGQRLMSVGDGEYKTELDNFDRIVACFGNGKGPESFTIWRNDGTIWEYGATEDSKIEAQGNKEVVLKWMISKISDRDGNSITYHYHENNEIGESYIEYIKYASNEKANVKPAYNVAFVYEDRLDPSVNYVYGNKMSNTKLLNGIEVYNNDSGKRIMEYTIKYDKPAYYDKDFYMHYRLSSVQLTIDGNKMNPTRVIWNSKDKWQTDMQNDFKNYELDKNIFNKMSFVGDFDADGFSDVLLVPYKVQDKYATDIQAEVYINNRDGTFAKEPLTKLQLNRNLDWIYVCDINGDGADDLVTYEIHYDETNAFDMVKLNLLIMNEDVFSCEHTYEFENNVLVLPGNYVNKDYCGLLLVDAYDGKKNKKMANYVYFQNGRFVSEKVLNSNAINGKHITCMAIDMSGDGISELLSLEDDGYKVYKIRKNNALTLEFYCSGQDMTNDIYTFPNDYNGDGKVDILYYSPAYFWNMVVSKGSSFSTAISCVDNSLLRYVRLNDKDRYRYSLREIQRPTVAIRTADFDGDGTADVGVFNSSAGNYYLEIGFAPYKKSSSSFTFSYHKRYYMPINYSHQTIQLGRFLPQENIAILSGLSGKSSNYARAYITSLYPNSTLYSVERIVDGMGNSLELTYDYLIDAGNGTDKFYTNGIGPDDGNIMMKSVPMLAVKDVKTYGINGNPVVERYSYSNALIHKKGHGFLGFESVLARKYVNNNLVQSQQCEYKLDPMGSNYILMKVSEKLFHGESQLVKEHYYEYEKYLCASNNKVVVPLLLRDREVSYDLDKKMVIKKSVVTKNVYDSDATTDGLYNKIVQLKICRKGYDNVESLYPEKCRYYEEIRMEYDNDIANWIVNRPIKIRKYVRESGNEIVGDAVLMEYDENNPTRLVKEISVPNVYANQSDSLLIVKQYKYDAFGNVVRQTLSSPSMKYDKVIKSEYGEKYQYRYKTKMIDELERAVMCEYDDFGTLQSTIDYNNLVTRLEKDAAGVMDDVTMPDGMRNVKVLRWARNNKYSPTNASYYSWEKSTGTAETMKFYHKSGAELRSVTFDINGDAVFVDKMYDDFGNMTKESYPYYENDEKLFVSNIYDAYNRIVGVSYPNGLNVSHIYDGNVLYTEYSGSDAVGKNKKETYNVMGWLTNTVDNGGNQVNYEYYSDGKLKSAQLGDDKNTRIVVTYDNRRNKSSLEDPNYGKVSYENDALGNVIRIVNEQDVVEMEYDVLGRMVSRLEKNLVHKTEDLVYWQYSRVKGKDGVLTKIQTTKNHQLEYEYDDNLRLLSTIEIINGVKYKTSYVYDKAGRPSMIVYPSGYSMSKIYSNSGYEKMLCDAETGDMLWKTDGTNSSGYITEFRMGNGLTTRYSYNPNSNMIENIRTAKGEKVLQDLSYKHDAMGNLTYRCDMLNYNCEEFEYDVYDRLTKITLNGELKGKMTYYDNGNISTKEIDGVKVMYNTKYSSDKPNAIVDVSSDDERLYQRFGQAVKYSFFDNVAAVNEKDKSVSLCYGYDNERVFMRCEVNGEKKEKTYVGNCEYVMENGKKKILTYLDGPMGVFAVHVDDGEKAINYIYKDNLESWNVVTDNRGVVLEKLSFDAWGNMRDPVKWELDVEEQALLYDRGFTGHEHLLDFGLINMNGRFYDPLMSMMLSPDNNIQQPQSSQSFNRYSYCLNNPLKYYDPTGEFVESVAFGVVGGATNLVLNARDIDSFGEAALLFGVGFVKGFLMEYTMGQSWFLQVGVNTLTSGLMSGVNKVVSISDGGFDFSGDDWNSVKVASHYGLGSGLVKNIMYTYFDEPTESQYGRSFFESSYNRELSHSMTSLVAHGVGCWFSGQSLLSNMKLQNVGFDLKMLGLVAKRIMSSYISGLDFGDEAMNKRAQDIKNSILKDIREEIPDYPDFEYEYSLRGVFVEDFRLYVVGNIFQMLPGEVIEKYPKPYYDEVITFPFSYSLFKTLFFDEE